MYFAVSELIILAIAAFDAPIFADKLHGERRNYSWIPVIEGEVIKRGFSGSNGGYKASTRVLDQYIIWCKTL